MLSRRALTKRIRDLEEERDFLRDALYVASGGTYAPVRIEIRVAEAIAPTENDTFLKNLFSYSE